MFFQAFMMLDNQMKIFHGPFQGLFIQVKSSGHIESNRKIKYLII